MRKDNKGNIGTYNGLEQDDMIKLSEDIILLMLEKDRKKKNFFAGKLELIGVVFLLALVGLGIFLIALRKSKKQNA
jgi:protein SCO1/2